MDLRVPQQNLESTFKALLGTNIHHSKDQTYLAIAVVRFIESLLSHHCDFYVNVYDTMNSIQEIEHIDDNEVIREIIRQNI